MESLTGFWRVFRTLCRRVGLAAWILLVGIHSLSQAQPAPSEAPPVIRPGMDRYDLRAAEDPSRSERLELARKSFERQRWEEGAKTLQSLFDDEHDSLVDGPDQVWRLVDDAAMALLKASPEPALAAYLSVAETVAARDLRQARLTQDRSALVRIARRYALTSAGQVALRDLIDVAVDEGNSDAVVILLQQLLRVESPQLSESVWRSQLVDWLKATEQFRMAEQIEQKYGRVPIRPDSSGPWRLAAQAARRTPSSQWGTVSGGPDGNSLSQLSDSIPLERWSIPLLSHRMMRSATGSQLRDMEESSTLGLNVLSTVSVADVVVTRTLSELLAIHADTGEIAWRTREWGPAVVDEQSDGERLLMLLSPESRRNSDLANRITHRLLFCASLGALSADSRRVYSLAHFPNERDQFELLVQSGFMAIDDDEPPESTYLFARDLRTGRIIWRAGGPGNDEFPGLPAAGTFFFGPPTPDGDELFVVGERAGDLYLFCLEAETGLVRWEQLLASAGQGIDRDTVRKNWTAPVAVRGSLVICPTTTGWVTAVDRIRRRIAWSSRLTERVPSEDGSGTSFEEVNRESSIDDRWAPSQPMLVGDRVVVTVMDFPDEFSRHSPTMKCLSATTGQTLWEQPKDNLIGLFGSWNETVLVFSPDSVQAIQLNDGTPAWNTPLKERLTGRPVLTDRGIVVPLLSGRFQLVDPASGELRDDSLSAIPLKATETSVEYSTDVRPLGNLTAAGGRLISTSPTALTTFEWSSEIDRWRADSPKELRAAIRYGHWLAVQGLDSEANSLLRDSQRLAEQDPAQLEALRTARWNTLLPVLKKIAKTERALSPTDRELQSELQAIAQTPEEKLAADRLSIDLEIQSGEWQSAWSTIRRLLAQPAEEPVQELDRLVHSDVWLSDRILQLGRLPNLDARKAARAAIQEEFQRLSSLEDEGIRSRVPHWFSDTGLVDGNLARRIEESDPQRKLSRWQQLAESSEPHVSQLATLRVIDVLAVPDWIGEARRRWKGLAPPEQWPEELRPLYEATRIKLDGVEDRHARSAPSWVDQPIDLQRLTDYSGTDAIQTRLPLRWVGAPCSGLAQFEYVYDDEESSVRILRQDGSQYWEMPLATNEENPVRETPPIIHAAGLNLYLMHMGILHAFSPVDRQALWRWHAPVNPDEYDRGVTRSTARNSRLYPVNQWRQELLENASEENRQVETANARCVVLRVGQSLQILDAHDGTALWRLNRCPSIPIRVDRDRIYGLDDETPFCRSVRSGRPMHAPDLHRPESPLVVISSPQLLNLREQPGDGRHWVVEGIRGIASPIPGSLETSPWDYSDDVSLDTAWSVAVPSDSYLGRGPGGTIVSLLGSGEVRSIDWATGGVTLIGNAALPEQPPGQTPANRYYSGSDREHFYLTCDLGEEHGELDAPAIPAFGRLIALPFDQTLPAWQVDTRGFLLVRGTRTAPFLPVLRLEAQTLADRNYQRVHLLILDKLTGKPVYEIKGTPSFGSGIVTCDYDSRAQSWSLYLATERIRLSMRPQSP